MSTQAVRQPHGDRHAGWLELFFDLVFVAFAAQLSHSLHGDPGARDFAVFPSTSRPGGCGST